MRHATVGPTAGSKKHKKFFYAKTYLYFGHVCAPPAVGQLKGHAGGRRNIHPRSLLPHTSKNKQQPRSCAPVAPSIVSRNRCAPGGRLARLAGALRKRGGHSSTRRFSRSGNNDNFQRIQQPGSLTSGGERVSGAANDRSATVALTAAMHATVRTEPCKRAPYSFQSRMTRIQLCVRLQKVYMYDARWLAWQLGCPETHAQIYCSRSWEAVTQQGQSYKAVRPATEPTPRALSRGLRSQGGEGGRGGCQRKCANCDNKAA